MRDDLGSCLQKFYEVLTPYHVFIDARWLNAIELPRREGNLGGEQSNCKTEMIPLVRIIDDAASNCSKVLRLDLGWNRMRFEVRLWLDFGAIAVELKADSDPADR